MNTIKDLFLLDPEIIFLNHGSFGACPRPVFAEYQRWQLELEKQPVEFLARKAIQLLRESRAILAEYINTQTENIVFFTNPTTAINMVARNLFHRHLNPLQHGDEILTTNHEYGAMDRTWLYLCKNTGVKYVRKDLAIPTNTPDEIVDQIWSGVTRQTRVIFISHITSPTAIRFPIKEICRRAGENGILSIIDGAHALGQIPVNIPEIGADIYTAACHKWMMAPKGASFLYAHPDVQSWLDPLVISWGYDSEFPSGSQFIDYHEWQGTRDIAPFLSVPAAIEFQEVNHWEKVKLACQELAINTSKRLSEIDGIKPIYQHLDYDYQNEPGFNWFSQMFAVQLPDRIDPQYLKQTLYEVYKIEIPVIEWNNKKLIRVSIQGYNNQEDMEKLIHALQELMK